MVLHALNFSASSKASVILNSSKWCELLRISTFPAKALMKPHSHSKGFPFLSGSRLLKRFCISPIASQPATQAYDTERHEVGKTINLHPKPLKHRRVESERASAAAANQVKSSFLRLPSELRLMIYDYLIPPEKEIHINLFQSILYGVRHTRWDYETWDDGDCACDWRIDVDEGSALRFLIPLKPRLCSKEACGIIGMKVVNLMLTCTFLYHDISPLIYQRLTFKFHAPDAFVVFASNLTSSSLQMIRSIYFDGRRRLGYEAALFTPITILPKSIRNQFANAQPLPPLEEGHVPRRYKAREPIRTGPSAWGAACLMMSEMRGLRKIKIHLSNFMFHYSHRPRRPCVSLPNDEVDVFVLEPLVHVRNALGAVLDDFELIVDWSMKTTVVDWTKKSDRVQDLKIKRPKYIEDVSLRCLLNDRWEIVNLEGPGSSGH